MNPSVSRECGAGRDSFPKGQTSERLGKEGCGVHLQGLLGNPRPASSGLGGQDELLVACEVLRGLASLWPLPGPERFRGNVEFPDSTPSSCACGGARWGRGPPRRSTGEGGRSRAGKGRGVPRWLSAKGPGHRRMPSRAGGSVGRHRSLRPGLPCCGRGADVVSVRSSRLEDRPKSFLPQLGSELGE